jgi:hypothetical protein
MGRSMNRALAVALLVFIAGTVRDVQWHATHDTQQEFETASKQAEVHWILWLGVLVLLAVTGLTLSRSRSAGRNLGCVLTFASAVVFAAVSVWHFIEHANGNDPEIAHVFLYATGFGIVVGATVALLAARRGQPPQPPPGSRARWAQVPIRVGPSGPTDSHGRAQLGRHPQLNPRDERHSATA